MDELLPLDKLHVVAVPHEEAPAGYPVNEDIPIPADERNHVDMWISARLPDGVEGHRALVFDCNRPELEVWVDDQVVSRVENPAADGLISIHAVAVDEVAGRRLAI